MRKPVERPIIVYAEKAVGSYTSGKPLILWNKNKTKNNTRLLGGGKGEAT